MSKQTDLPLYLTFSLPTEETQHETVSAAVEQLTVFSQESGGDWQVRFRDVPNRMWIPHPMSMEGIILPCPSGISGKRAVYRRIDVSQKPVGRVYTGEEIQTFSGYWQPWMPELTPGEERRKLETCLRRSRPLPIRAIIMGMRCLLPGFFNRFSRNG